MGLFRRLFKKVEAVNKGDAALSELDNELYLETTVEEAHSFWREIAQNIIVNTVKATNNTVDRAFILVDMGEEPALEIFYQMDGRLVMWHELEDSGIKEKVENQLLPQAPEVASAVNDEYTQANHPKIAFAELQFEWATGAWFSHVIWDDDNQADLAREEIISNWFRILSEEIQTKPLDSDTKFSWYP